MSSTATPSRPPTGSSVVQFFSPVLRGSLAAVRRLLSLRNPTFVGERAPFTFLRVSYPNNNSLSNSPLGNHWDCFDDPHPFDWPRRILPPLGVLAASWIWLRPFRSTCGIVRFLRPQTLLLCRSLTTSSRTWSSKCSAGPASVWVGGASRSVRVWRSSSVRPWLSRRPYPVQSWSPVWNLCSSGFRFARPLERQPSPRMPAARTSGVPLK